MYILTIEDDFSSAHQLRGYKGKCENIHGHNWKVVASIKGNILNEIGLLIDFHDLKKMLSDILKNLDHQNINDIPPFDTLNPSSENIAKYISDTFNEKLKEVSKDIQIDSITVWESQTSRCTYKPE